MQIQNANVSLSNQHQFQRSEQKLSVEIENGRLVEEPVQQSNTATPAASVALNTSRTALSSTVDLSQFRVAAQPLPNQADSNEIQQLDIETSLLKALVEAMTGKPLHDPIVSAGTNQPALTGSEALSVKTSRAQIPPPPERTQVNLTLINEYEYSDVSIRASLTTADGSEIEIGLSVIMERRYQESTLGVLRREGLVTDPLVINFSGDTARLSPGATQFDLDSDGRTEALPTLSSNSAYIALDKNGNGVIDNGSELFGPQSGNGFSELAQYDEDGNGFIDAGDSIYSQLTAFRPNQAFNHSLQELGVDALYLAAVDSPFRITDNNNQTLGQVRATSFYVSNSGQAGSIQQVDLAV